MRRVEVFIAGASVRAASQSAVKSGVSVVAADLFADTDTGEVAQCRRVADYPNDLLRLRREYSHLPLIYTGALENYPAILEEFANSGPLWGNHATSVRKLGDPLNLQHVFRQRGIRFPHTTRSPPMQDASWLRKKIRSAGGQHVQFVSPSSGQLSGYFYQEFVDGLPCSASYIASEGHAELLGVTEMLVGCDWLGGKQFAYCGSISRICDTGEIEQWKQLGEIVAHEFDLVGVFGIDGILHGSGLSQVTPIEVNPRFTASMEVIELVHGTAIMGHHIRAFDGQHQIRALPRKPHAAKAILYADRPVVIPPRLLSPAAEIKYADVPHPKSFIQQGQPILSIVVASDDGDPRSKLRLGAVRVRQQLLTHPTLALPEE